MSLLQLGLKDKARGFAKFLSVRAHDRPYAITLELTRRCNARCDYCDHWREPRRNELDTNGFIEVVRHFDPLSVTLCGGEPFMRRDVLDIAAGIKQLPGWRYMSIITNGWFLSEQRAEELLATGIDQINVSLNWPDVRQDDDRKLPGLFAKISHIVPWLVARGANVQLNSILMKDNLDLAIPIVELADSWGAKVLFTLYSELPAGNHSHLFPPEAREKLRGLTEELRMLRKMTGVVANEDWYLEQIPRYVDGATIGGCTAGKKTLHITPEGLVRPCAELPPITHYRDYDLAAQPWTDCTACFQACRGEAQAPLTAKRIFEYLVG
jgi:MoaA/NifB/PqqE/SkfB family radical SAM enzyme